MLGAIAGDVVGSVYEFDPIKTEDFPLFIEGSRFTDDSVLTVAVASAIVERVPYAGKFKEFGRMFPAAGYGGMFSVWLSGDSTDPYNSFGNGSAMRVSPVGYAFETLQEVLAEAERSSAVTHDHPEGIKGAQATAAAIFLCRKGASREEVKEYVEKTFSYDLSEPLESIREWYSFDVTCQGTVPQAITAFLESRDFEDSLRKAVSLGGDSDTVACITGGISEAFYGGVPPEIAAEVSGRLDPRLLAVVEEFNRRFPVHGD